MTDSYCYVPYRQTGYFSKLVTDYLDRDEKTQPFYTYFPDEAGIAEAIHNRNQYPVDRGILTQVLQQQYADLPTTPAVTQNIQLLSLENTFSVCTAHQPNLMTGYLYFIYKILHTIKLAKTLTEQHPGKHFVPIYYMGSEDNDLEELGVFRFREATYRWDGNGQTGAVGRMDTKSLKPLINELLSVFGPPGENEKQLREIVQAAYLQHYTIGKATQYLVNALFSQFGLVIVDPDHALLKKQFTAIMAKELTLQESKPIVDAQINLLENHYKAQAHPRAINLFYVKDQIRERIVAEAGLWKVNDTNIQFTEEALLTELDEHPERFSPNVILRGLFQESILPNVAFIGGGAEVAYWLQLKTLFTHHGVFYPAIMLRQSVMWMEPDAVALQKQLSFTTPDLFKPSEDLVKLLIQRKYGTQLQTTAEAEAMKAILLTLKEKAVAIDPTLEKAADAVLHKMTYRLQTLEQKMYRAEKRKMEVDRDRITRLKKKLFPANNLQERVNNMAEFYLDYGVGFINKVFNGIEPLQFEFLIVAPNAS